MPLIRLPNEIRSAAALILDKDGVLLDFHRFWGEVTRLRVSGIARAASLDESDARALTRELGVVDGRVDPEGPLSVGTRQDAMALAAGFLYRRGMAWSMARPLAERAFDDAEAHLDWEAAVAPLGALKETLRDLVAQGWKLGIATTDRTQNARRHADMLGISPLIGAIVGADSVSRSKPHPDLVHACAEKLGVAPEDCLVVGDAVADLLMARAAACAGAIGVLSGVCSRDMLVPHADMILDGVWELPRLRSADGTASANPLVSS